MNTFKERRLRGAIPIQREVAVILGVRNYTVSKWEHGISRPHADKLLLWAKLCGYTV